MSSEACDVHAQEISAFLDGELPFPDCLPAVDHLAGCEACRAFYASARRLSERVLGDAASPAPDRVWTRIAERAGGGRAATPGRRRLYALALTAAAVLVLALVLPHRRGPVTAVAESRGPSAPAAIREIVVEGARGRMTDERFVSLLAEILSADEKYHRETERVMSTVLQREAPAESAEPDTERNEQDHESAPGAEKAKPARAPALQS